MSKTFQFTSDDTTLNNFLGGKNVVKAFQIPIEQLHRWENQPFKAYPVEQLIDLAKSIDTHGLLHHPVVLKVHSDYYRILSGHNRVAACRLLNWTTVPCIVKENMSSLEAEAILLDSNLQQRQSLSHKEKILAYSRAYTLHKKLRLGTKTNYQDDVRTVQRYAQMGKLNAEMIDLIDNGQLPLGVAYELSFLDDDKQDIVLTYLLNHDLKLTTDKARELRQLHDTLTPETLEEVVYTTIENDQNKIVAKTMHKIANKTLPIVMDLHDLQQLITFLVEQQIIK